MLSVTENEPSGGEKPKARTFNAMMAATALAHDLTVHSCNPQDFEGIDDLRAVHVPHPDHR